MNRLDASLLKKWFVKSQIYIANIAWLMGDKVFTVLITFFVTVAVARYLGPEEFGILSYVLSLTALFSAAGHMGLSGLVVREIVQNPDDRSKLMGTAFALKLIGMTCGYVILLCGVYLYSSSSNLELLMIAVAGLALLISPLNVIDFWFQSFLQARYVTIANISGIVSGAMLKLLLIFLGGGVIYFAAAPLLQALVIGAVLIMLFSKKSGRLISSWSFDKHLAGNLFRQGWLVYLGTIFAVVNMKIDQVMLRWLDGPESVGIYAVAAQLSETWYFIPTAIVASFFPRLIDLKSTDENQYYKRLQQLLDGLFILALTVAVFMTFAGSVMINIFFGELYADSAPILAVHIWAAIFVFMRAVFSRWILIEGFLVFSLLTQGLGALLNILLNMSFIPEYGGLGAAYATFASYAMSSYISLAIYSKTRKMFWLMTKAMFCPVSYLFHYAKKAGER